jgi:hypothetical protein
VTDEGFRIQIMVAKGRSAVGLLTDVKGRPTGGTGGCEVVVSSRVNIFCQALGAVDVTWTRLVACLLQVVEVLTTGNRHGLFKIGQTDTAFSSCSHSGEIGKTRRERSGLEFPLRTRDRQRRRTKDGHLWKFRLASCTSEQSAESTLRLSPLFCTF